MLTLTCRNCGVTKSPADYAANVCPDCQKSNDDGATAFQAANPEAPLGDVLRAGKEAMLHRAHVARKNYMNPGDFAAQRGQFPTPPPPSRP